MRRNFFGWGHFPYTFHDHGSGYGFDAFSQRAPQNSNSTSFYHEHPQQRSYGHQESERNTRPASKKQCYYDVLQISKTADLQEIKKAYRKQSLIWHPDKNAERKSEAEEKFKLISEAYQILSDDEKRRDYDRYGMDPTLKESDYSDHEEFYSFGTGMEFISPFDLFERIFDEFRFDQDPFMGSFFSSSSSRFFPADPFEIPSPFGAVSFSDPFRMLSQTSNALMYPPFYASSSPFDQSMNILRPSNFYGSQSTSKTSSVVNGRRVTVIETTDSQGNVTREVIYS